MGVQEGPERSSRVKEDPCGPRKVQEGQISVSNVAQFQILVQLQIWVEFQFLIQLQISEQFHPKAKFQISEQYQIGNFIASQELKFVLVLESLRKT